MTAHPMMPAASHDEGVEQLFVRDLKTWLGEVIEPLGRARAAALDPGPLNNAQVDTVYEKLHGDSAFRSWLSLRRTSQEMLWAVVADGVDRQRPALEAAAAAAPALGSLTVDPDFVTPPYLEDCNVHLMPGGYLLDDGLVTGAVMDRGGAVYMLGRNGGLMNDARGKTVVAHLLTRFPGFQPKRILELGCGVGASIVPVALAYPDAEVHGVDVGASMLRYAHARASHLGVAVNFAQDNAEHTAYPDGSFDLIFSCVLLHETSEPAIARVLAESRRLLAPGGVAVHLEVPNRYETMDLWGKIRGRIEADYNNEPAWQAAISVDYEALMRQAGFTNVATGYQDASFTPLPVAGEFSAESKGVFRSWFIAAGQV